MSDLNSLYEELASAECRVQADGRSMEMRSVDEIKQAIEVLKNELRAQGLYTGPTRPRMIRIASRSGF